MVVSGVPRDVQSQMTIGLHLDVAVGSTMLGQSDQWGRDHQGVCTARQTYIRLFCTSVPVCGCSLSGSTDISNRQG